MEALGFCDVCFGDARAWYNDLDFQLVNGGLPSDCSDEQFASYSEEVRPVASRVVDIIGQED